MNAAPKKNVLTGLLDEEKGNLRIDIENGIEFILRDIRNRFLEHLSNGVDCNVDASKVIFGSGEELLDVGHLGEVALNDKCITSLGLDLGSDILGLLLGSVRMVVDHDLGTQIGELKSDEGTQIFGTTGNEGNLSLKIALINRSRHEVVELGSDMAS